ncbi:MAG: hypothetical protein IIA14_14420 [SAR324 cluster bacterium]|nr:hypothetical protein [SAR324 cluster bacterium]
MSRGACAQLALLLTLVTLGCTKADVIRDPLRAPILPEVVDSVVVELPKAAAGLTVNPVDLETLRDLLRDELQSRPKLSTFDEPPTKLPNTVIVSLELTEHEVRDQPGEGLFLRAIHLGGILSLKTAGGEAPWPPIARRLSFQKVYLPEDEIPVGSFDLHMALVELAAQFAEAVYPTPLEAPIPLRLAEDPVSGESLANPMLLRGNKFAAEGRFRQARNLWSLVLFDPTAPPTENTYRISLRSLFRLREDGLPAEVLEKLEPLVNEANADLITFRENLREALDGPSPHDGKILERAIHERDRIQLNLAAAHANLAAVNMVEKRLDLTAYHLARGYALYPLPGLALDWGSVQKKRNLYPGALPEREALTLYLKAPPPRGLTVRPGMFEQEAIPMSEFRDPQMAAEQKPVPEGEEGAVRLTPVKLPPVEGDARGARDDLPPIESPVLVNPNLATPAR